MISSWLFFLEPCFAFFLAVKIAHFGVLYSLFMVTVLQNFSSFLHQGPCWWRYLGFYMLFIAVPHTSLEAICGFSHMMSTLYSPCSLLNRFRKKNTGTLNKTSEQCSWYVQHSDNQLSSCIKAIPYWGIHQETGMRETMSLITMHLLQST